MLRTSAGRRLMSKVGPLLPVIVAVLLGGRAAEALTFDEVSTGASDDLARATNLARRMITEFGMIPMLGPSGWRATRRLSIWDHTSDWTAGSARRRPVRWMPRRGASSRRRSTPPRHC